MKKNLFFLFALICSTSLFTACSDDEKDTSWKEFPTEIPAENVTLDVNGGLPAEATASIEIKSGEVGVVTLTNAVYGHASIPVNVAMTKVDENSYDFEGSANIDGTTKAAAQEDLGLTVTVKGSVTKAGKLTVKVTTSGWGSIGGVYSGDSLAMTLNGVASNAYPVTVTLNSEAKATLTFGKIVNVAIDFPVEVAMTKEGEGYKLEGSALHEGSGKTVNVTGSIANNVLTVDLILSGYGTINKSYSATDEANELTFNGEVKKTGSITVQATSETEGTISSDFIVGPNSSAKLPIKLTKAEDSETYTLSGNGKTEEYEWSFEGTVSPESTMKGDFTYKILSPIVGKWGVKMGAQGAETIFKFASKKGSVTFPDAIINMLPEELKPMFPATMPDAQLVPTIKGLLGQYVPYLQYIEFTEGGSINIAYTAMGSTEVSTISGMLNYYVKDNQAYMVIDIFSLMSMSNSLKSADLSTKAWNPSNFLTDGIPFDFTAESGTLNIWLNHEVVSGLLPILNTLLPAFGGMLGDKAEMVIAILGAVNGIVSESTEFEAGLVLVKK
ncbi:DUF4925 domain-containing protein [Parabacteroides sp. AM08-6]|uniref:DUF4925 domain-containing protein n=1 Tax=Parabacteroides sp. AM08-6 TaxID=2292053 RepID=UPI000EFE5ED9|nr:DUF4925 domain-containing protein [Parabacteroides sp. AM08-6]RHJ87679.1 DUF4925 domain-containing protein [Parabacteroides sp. AM08-6]